MVGEVAMATDAGAIVTIQIAQHQVHEMGTIKIKMMTMKKMRMMTMTVAKTSMKMATVTVAMVTAVATMMIDNVDTVDQVFTAQKSK